jgi:hypothetical protein
MALVVLLFASAFLTSCTRTVLVKPGEPVRLAEPTRAKVWVADKDGKEVKGTVTLPEGWFCLPDDE